MIADDGTRLEWLGGAISTEKGCPRPVRGAPGSDRIADIAGGPVRAITGPFACSLDYFIGTHEEPRRYGKPQLLGCLEVDGQLEFGYLVDWDVAGICSSENCVDIVADALIQFDQVDGVGH